MNVVRWCGTLWTALTSWRGRSKVAPAQAAPSKRQAAPSQHMERVWTHARLGQFLGMQQCRCSVCGVVRQCTPDFDFYATEDDSPLICHDCFFPLVVHAQNSGIKA